MLWLPSAEPVADLLLRGTRDPWTGQVRDVLIREGRVHWSAPGSAEAGLHAAGPGADALQTEVLDAEGRWLLPGLWDRHVHLDQWAQARTRLDLSATACAEDVLAAIDSGLRAAPGQELFVGFGHRSAGWPRQPSVAELDAVTEAAAPGRAVVLISGDMHSAWLNTAALDLLGAVRTPGLLAENAWFEVYTRLEAWLPSAEDLVPGALSEAAARGVVGITDLEFAPNPEVWAQRAARPGWDALRISAGVYAEDLDAVLQRGLRTGDRLVPAEQDPEGLFRMGPLKIISDGSLGTGTAHCCAPYLDPPDPMHPQGRQNEPPETLHRLLGTAVEHGLDVALHAIGDAAVDHALHAFQATGARGSIEHAQLVRTESLPLMAALGLTASVQPAHLLDDRDTTERLWGQRSARCFMLASMAEHGIGLAFGSDAPVSPLDPWLAMAAAVHRSADARPAWHPEQALAPGQALAASTGGVVRVEEGMVADLVLSEENPLGAPGENTEAAGRRLREMAVAATFVAGRPTHLAL